MEAAQRRLERERKESVELPIEDERRDTPSTSVPVPNEDSRTRASESTSKIPQTTGRIQQPTVRTPQPQDRKKTTAAEVPEAEVRTPEERKTMEASSKKEDGGVKGNGGKRMEEGMEGG